DSHTGLRRRRLACLRAGSHGGGRGRIPGGGGPRSRPGGALPSRPAAAGPLCAGLERDPNALAIALYLDGSDDPDRAADGTWLLDDDFLVLVNAWWGPLDFTIGPVRPGQAWQLAIDSYDP